MRLTVLGSGTVVPDPTRSCAAYHLETGGVRLLLDCGPGATYRMAGTGVGWARLTHIAISHFHTDHTGDLPFLLFALKHGLQTPRSEPLTLFGPAGTLDRLRAMGEAFGTYVLHPGVRLVVHEMGSGHTAELAPGVLLRAFETRHSEEALAYSVEAEGRRLAYTGDTGPNDELAAWLAGADTLLAECSLPDELRFEAHLSPAWLAELARTARPGRLVVTHVYPQLDRQAVPRLVRDAGWTGELVMAEDGLTLDV